MHPGRHAGDPRRDVCRPAGLPGRKPAMGPPQPNTHTQPRRDPSPPPRIIGARSPASRTPAAPAQAGRAEARSLTRASRAHEQAAARERDTRGQFTMPCKPLCGRETAGRTPLDTGPLLQGCTLTGLFHLCSLPGGQIGRLCRTGGVSQSGGSLVGALAPSPVASSWVMWLLLRRGRGPGRDLRREGPGQITDPPGVLPGLARRKLLVIARLAGDGLVTVAPRRILAGPRSWPWSRRM